MKEYTPAEIESKSGLSVSEVMDYIQEGFLVAEKKGDDYRVREEDLNDFLDMKAKGKMSVKPSRKCGE